MSEERAIRAYQRIHEGNAEKRAISKDQKADRELVKDYLDRHPEGFKVWLEDARGNNHEYHVKVEDATRVALDKAFLAHKLGINKAEVTPSVLAAAVEEGKISVHDIETFEDVTSHKAIKRTKIKRPVKKKDREAAE